MSTNADDPWVSVDLTPVLQDTDKKLAELIVYVAQLSEGDEQFGATKLNKILFYCDFLHYLYHRESITGQEYQKLNNGPAPRRGVPVLEYLEWARDIKQRKEECFSYVKTRTLALREPDLSLFSGTEVALVAKVIKEFWGKTATEVSDLSHKFVGWQLMEIGETIPYEYALISTREPTEQEIEWGKELEPIARKLVGANAP